VLANASPHKRISCVPSTGLPGHDLTWLHISHPARAFILHPQLLSKLPHDLLSLLDRDRINRDALAELVVCKPPRDPALITHLSPTFILFIAQASAELRDWIVEWMISITALDRLETFELVI
jgi:hypothetical protein